ncbi:MAG: Cna B-type domain-containing protein [Lachnospiraceae bacterium]
MLLKTSYEIFQLSDEIAEQRSSSLSTDSTDAMPVSEVSTQSADKPSAISPETISVTLSWGNSNEQSVTLTSGSSSEYGSVTKISENQWTYEFQSIPKYDDTKSAYTYTVTPEADGYSFSKLGMILITISVVYLQTVALILLLTQTKPLRQQISESPPWTVVFWMKCK